MAQLTVKEKEHWKERIGRKVDHAIDQLLAQNDKHYLARIAADARQMAIDSLGVREMQSKLKEIDGQEESLRQERQHILKAMVAQATGRPIEELPAYFSHPPGVDRAITSRTELHEQELLEKDDLGRKILALRREKEEMLDTVWLATSGKHIRELWMSVTELLQESPTMLQTKALSIEPDPDQD